jgi:hypothetical protein
MPIIALRATSDRAADSSTPPKASADAAKRNIAMKRADSPFQHHWLYYAILKYAVIAAAVLVAIYTVYRLYLS